MVKSDKGKRNRPFLTRSNNCYKRQYPIPTPLSGSHEWQLTLNFPVRPSSTVMHRASDAAHTFYASHKYIQCGSTSCQPALETMHDVSRSMTGYGRANSVPAAHLGDRTCLLAQPYLSLSVTPSPATSALGDR